VADLVVRLKRNEKGFSGGNAATEGSAPTESKLAAAYLHARQSFKLISAFSSAFFSIEGCLEDDATAEVAYVATS